LTWQSPAAAMSSEQTHNSASPQPHSLWISGRSSGVEDVAVTASGECTVAQLKQIISQSHPRKIPVDRITLRYQGRLLTNDQRLDEFRNPAMPPVVQLVLPLGSVVPSLHRSESGPDNSNSTPTSPSPADIRNQRTRLRHRQRSSLSMSAAHYPATLPHHAQLLQQYYQSYYESQRALWQARAANGGSMPPSPLSPPQQGVGAPLAPSPEAYAQAYQAWLSSLTGTFMAAGGAVAAGGAGAAATTPGAAAVPANNANIVPPTVAAPPPPQPQVQQPQPQPQPIPNAAAALPAAVAGANPEPQAADNNGRFAQAGIGAMPMLDAQDEQRERPRGLAGYFFLICKLTFMVAIFGQAASNFKFACLVAFSICVFLYQVGFFALVFRFGGWLAGERGGDHAHNFNNANGRAAGAAGADRQAGAGVAGNGAPAAAAAAATTPSFEDVPRSLMGEVAAIVWAFFSSLWPTRADVMD